jgi:hypothetical protein
MTRRIWWAKANRPDNVGLPRPLGLRFFFRTNDTEPKESDIRSPRSISHKGLLAAVRSKLSKRLLLVSGAANPRIVSKLAREKR